jgi:hypothetical protein
MPVDLSRFVTPLRLIFWGVLLCVFDFHFSWLSGGEGLRLDVLSDFVGMILILIGIFRIVRLVPPGESGPLVFVGCIAVVSTAVALMEHMVFKRPAPLVWALHLLGLAELVAILMFCRSMRSLCFREGLTHPMKSWTVTFWLFFAIYLIPLGAFHLAVLVAMATGSSFQFDLGVAGLLLLPVFFWPLVHFFVSTSRMTRAARSPIARTAAAPVQ